MFTGYYETMINLPEEHFAPNGRHWIQANEEVFQLIALGYSAPTGVMPVHEAGCGGQWHPRRLTPHSPTYRSRRARAEPSRSRQMWLTTVVSQAPGDSMAPCCCRDMAYQRA